MQKITSRKMRSTKRLRDVDDGPRSRSDVMRADRKGGILSALGVGKETLAYQLHNSAAKTIRQTEGE